MPIPRKLRPSVGALTGAAADASLDAHGADAAGERRLADVRPAALRRLRPELAALLVLAAVLDLWALGRDAWANEYYSAAVRSMSGSWHAYGSSASTGGGLYDCRGYAAALRAYANR